MRAKDYIQELCDTNPKEWKGAKNLTVNEWLEIMEAYHLSLVKDSDSLPCVSVSSLKIHLVDVDGDVIESLNIISNAEKLRDVINSDPESIAHHYQVMIRDER